MPAYKIPNTSRVIFLPQHCGDVNIDMSELVDVDTVISQEDKQSIGTYTDSDGKILNTKNAQEVMLAGLANDFGEDVMMKAMGKRMAPLNERGKRIDTHFTKNKTIIINTGEKKDAENSD